jgi:PAS domain S-box-containing protein
VQKPTRLVVRYALAVVLTGVFLFLRFALQPVLGPSVPYLQFFPAIMLAAWFGGLGPGLLATALSSALAAYFFLEPLGSIQVHSTADLVSLPLFGGIGATIALLVESLRRSETAHRASAMLAIEQANRLDAEAAAQRDAARRVEESSHAATTARQRLAEVVSSVPGVVWEAWGEPDTATQRIDFVSDYVKTMLGYEPAAWISMPNFWLTIVHPEDRERAAAEARAIFDSGERGRSEFRWVHRDGHVLWVEAHSQAVVDELGRPVGMRGVTLDLSDRRQLEQERATLLRREQTARADAVAANSLKDDFLATLSHELRTPLNAILGYARMLRTGMIDPPRQARAMETIERNASVLSQMVEDVLDVSRIVAGKIRLDVQPVDVAQIVEEAIATVKPAADARGIRLESVLDPHAGPVAGDGERLQQVVWNLLSNAVKFTPRNGRVQIRLARVDSHVEIVVSDTGIGIPQDFLPHVFERFRQADSRFSREYGGLGLGLAIARDIVHLHGGTIHVSSDGEGTGSTFRVNLPVPIALTESGPGIRREKTGASVEHDEANGRLAGLHVLVVDDDADATSLMREVLEAAGAAVISAGSGAEALRVLAATPADVLVTDIGMPGMDGFELVGELRRSQDPALRNLPAAALTAYARSEDRTRALKQGFQMHLAKPIDPAELVAAVAALGRRGESRIAG